jgi:hypothetical protein
MAFVQTGCLWSAKPLSANLLSPRLLRPACRRHNRAGSDRKNLPMAMGNCSRPVTGPQKAGARLHVLMPPGKSGEEDLKRSIINRPRRHKSRLSGHARAESAARIKNTELTARRFPMFGQMMDIPLLI